MNADEECPLFGGEYTEYTYPCPECGGTNTGGNYDAELCDDPNTQPDWLCFDCKKGFDITEDMGLEQRS